MDNIRPPTVREQQLKAQVAEMMIRDRCQLIQRQPFIGHLAMHLNLVPVIDSRMTTASTDGTRLFMDAEFYLRMAPEDRLSILAHEVWHCALRHFQRKGERDLSKFNIACDVEVGMLLRSAGFNAPRFPYFFSGKSAEQIYDLLNYGMGNCAQTEDKHIYPEEFQKGKDSGASADSEVEKKEADKAGKQNDGTRKGSQQAGQKRTSGQDQGSESENQTRLPRVSHDGVIDPDYQPSFEDDVADDWKNNLKNAVEQEKKRGGKRNGKIPGNVEDLVKNDTRKATVDWKRVLLDYVTQIFGGERQWLPPARRYVWKKLYLPSRARKKTIKIVLAIDTSGSTTSDLPDFLAELRGMVNAFGEYKLTIIQCDIKIHSVKEYSNDDPLPVEGLRFRGFGGTSFHEPFRYVEEKMEPPTVFIYLTDGFGNAPEQPPVYPVIWCVTNNGHKPAKWGLEVRITRSQKT